MGARALIALLEDELAIMSMDLHMVLRCASLSVYQAQHVRGVADATRILLHYYVVYVFGLCASMVCVWQTSGARPRAFIELCALLGFTGRLRRLVSR